MHLLLSEPKALKLSEDSENGTEIVVNGNGTETEVRCETCGAVFSNLIQFMDHRNFDCDAGTLYLVTRTILILTFWNSIEHQWLEHGWDHGNMF